MAIDIDLSGDEGSDQAWSQASPVLPSVLQVTGLKLSQYEEATSHDASRKSMLRLSGCAFLSYKFGRL